MYNTLPPKHMIFTNQIKKAIRFSIKTHEVYQKQKRKGKDIPYIVHPLTVAIILARAGASADIVAAGILHDTIEDSVPGKKVTETMLKERFGAKVAGIVADVSENSKFKTWEERKTEAIDHIRLFSRDSLLVKAADVLGNGSEIIEDHQDDGDKIFLRFSASKEKIIWYYRTAIAAILKNWPKIPLAKSLKKLDVGLKEISS